MYKTYLFKSLAVVLLMTCVVRWSFPIYATAENTVDVQSSASSAVLYEPSSGRVLYEKQAHIQRPMASTTKLMTALLAVELLSPTAVLTASEQALRVEGSSMGLCVGDTISRDDLLRGLLLSSGNDAANVLALSMASSFEEFALLMNARAQNIGMNNTVFVTPSGLDERNHGASAYDMALLAAEVLKNDLLVSICSSKQAEITVGGRRVWLKNHNKLLSQYDGCIGLKTGYTSRAGRCLVSAAERDGVTLVVVTLDCANDWEEHTALLDEGFSLTERVTPPSPKLPNIAVFGGKESAVVCDVPAVFFVVMQEDVPQIETHIIRESYVWAPIKRGTVLGTVEYRLRGTALMTVPITASRDISIQEREPWLSRTRRLVWLLLRELLT